MKKTLRVLICALVVMMASGAVFAQKSTRIKFARGAKSIVVTGYLRNYRDSKNFVIRTRRGQTLKTKQVGKNYITVGITQPDGTEFNDADASCNNHKIVDDTEAGDYKITVFECRKADRWRGNFKLRITVK
jgi:hypothetical protein